MYKCDMLEIPFDKVKYDLIFSSWGLEYQNDDQAIELLNKARLSLYDGQAYGIMVIKENNRNI